MMVYAWIGSLVAALAAGAYGGYQWESGRWAQESAARLEAEAKLQQQVDAAKQEAQDKITDMEAAYEAGQSKAKTVYVRVQQRAQADVGAYPVFANRACDWPPPVVQLVNSAFANLHAPADTAIAPATLPAPAAAAGGAAGSGLPVADVPAGAVVEVRPDARAAGGGGPLPAAGSGKPPKPIPRQKGVTQ